MTFFRIVVAAILLLTLDCEVETASADSFSFGSNFRTFRLPKELPHLNQLSHDLSHSRDTLGILAAGTIGSEIFGKLTQSERRDISRKVNKVVVRDLDREVVESYDTNKSRQGVVIKASPSQAKVVYKDDPLVKAPTTGKQKATTNSLSQSNETATSQAAVQDAAKKPKPGADRTAEDESANLVSFDDVPETAKCRRVETEVSSTDPAASLGETKASKSTAIVCQMGPNDWKPVGPTRIASAP
jgi:hypothetical protein